MVAGDGVVTQGNFGSSLLQQLGMPSSPAWVDIVNQWVASEGGFNASLAKATNNPLNARCNSAKAQRGATSYFLWGYAADTGATGCTTSGFIIWPNLEDAVAGYAELLHTSSHYVGIRNAQSPDALKAAIIASPWAGGHYGNGKNWAQSGNNPNAGSGGESQPNSGGTSAPGINLPDLNPLDAINSIWQGIVTDTASILIFIAGALLFLFGLYKLVTAKTGIGVTDVAAAYLGMNIAERKAANVGRAGRASPEEAYSTSAARAAGRKAGAAAPIPEAPRAAPPSVSTDTLAGPPRSAETERAVKQRQRKRSQANRPTLIGTYPQSPPGTDNPNHAPAY